VRACERKREGRWEGGIVCHSVVHLFTTTTTTKSNEMNETNNNGKFISKHVLTMTLCNDDSSIKKTIWNATVTTKTSNFIFRFTFNLIEAPRAANSGELLSYLSKCFVALSKFVNTVDDSKRKSFLLRKRETHFTQWQYSWYLSR
jgi:hypothetical protein